MGPSPLRLIKRWMKYGSRDEVRNIPANTRGVYVLYMKEGEAHGVVYIGVAGLGKDGGGGACGRLKGHMKSKRKKWSHFSLFEVHDNITREEIRELEILLLGIFRDDDRIKLANSQLGSGRLYKLKHPNLWKNPQS